MTLYVREYEWMWVQLGLSLAECRVFAYIYGLTNKNTIGAKGYTGSKSQLATRLGLDKGGVKKILDSLMDRHLIVYSDGLWQSVESVNESVESVNENVESVNTPNPPIINNNKMENNEINARAHLRPALPKDLSSFEELVKAFKSKAGNYQLSDSVLDDARRMWSSDRFPEWKRKMLIAKLQRGEWLKSRLDWTVGDFDPQPDNWNGRELEKGRQYKTAKWNGKWGTYTVEDVENFGMKEGPSEMENGPSEM